MEAQFVAAAREVGLRIEPRADGLWRVEHVLADLRSERLRSVQKVGKAESSYRKITFHKHHLEQDVHVDAVLMGPGHPLYAAVDEKLNERLAELVGRVAFFIEPLCTDPYRIHFFEISIRGKDSKGNDVPLYGELVAVREERGHYEIIPSDILLNFAAHPHPPQKIEPTRYCRLPIFLKRATSSSAAPVVSVNGSISLRFAGNIWKSRSRPGSTAPRSGPCCWPQKR